jgi:uncharacterized membrane protein YjdF
MQLERVNLEFKRMRYELSKFLYIFIFNFHTLNSLQGINNITMDFMQLEWIILELKWIKYKLNRFQDLFLY